MLTLKTLALVLGPTILIVHIPFLFNPKGTVNAIKKVVSDSARVQILGVLSIMFGLLILRAYYKIEQDWKTVMSVIGYIAVIKGVVRVWFPSVCANIVKKALGNPVLVALCALVGLIIGAGLIYLGLYVY